jgi:NitT/TauT family transport system substrate-binding protein
MKFLGILSALAALAMVAAAPAGADAIRIGTVKIAAAGSVFIAQDKGYFAAEGLDATIVYFDAPGPISAAVVAGDVDVGTTGSSAGLYSLVGQGAVKIIAAQAHEAPGFQINAFAVSNHAYDAGLKTYRDLTGHSVGVAQVGGPTHYAAALVIEKYGVDLKTMRFLPLQSNPNVLSAVSGGTADTGVIPATIVVPAVARGAFKLLGWIGDETPWQSSAVFASARTADERPDLLRRFLRAYRKGGRDYHNAFTAADGTRADGPSAPEILAIFAKYTGQTVAQLRLGIAYVDPDARLDFADIRHQIAWFKAQNMLKKEVDADTVIDRRFALPLSAN